VVWATVVAVALSLAADALLVGAGTRVFPSTRGDGHFRPGDYATLTVIGVVAAGLAWPVVVRVSPAPRWLYLRLACLVTVVLWVPDVVLLARHQPARAVLVLMVMHLAVAVVTYNVMVRLAPAGRMRGEDAGGPLSDRAESAASGRSGPPASAPAVLTAGVGHRRAATVLVGLLVVEFSLGIAVLLTVPTGRPTGWLPTDGRVVYLAHALLGLPLAVGAVLYLTGSDPASRLDRLSGRIGLVGTGLAGLGGLLTVVHPLRLAGIGLMLVGPLIAVFGYLIPALERLTEGDAPEGDG
jgi:hypothetical protein